MGSFIQTTKLEVGETKDYRIGKQQGNLGRCADKYYLEGILLRLWLSILGYADSTCLIW